MNSIVYIAHTTIQFPQNNDTFLCRFFYLVKSPKNAPIFCGFLCNMEKLQSCNSCYKRFTEKSQTCNHAGEKDRSPSHNFIHTYIFIYIHIKELQKELQKELHLGATLPLWELCFAAVELQKFRLQKFHIFSF